MSYLKRIFNKEYNVEITPNEEINHLEYSNSSIYSEIEKMIKKEDLICFLKKKSGCLRLNLPWKQLFQSY